MAFSSWIFVLFFGAVYLLYVILGRAPGGRKGMWLQNLLLLAASYSFYAYLDWQGTPDGSWNGRFVYLIAASTALHYVCALLMDRSENARARKTLLLVSVAGSLVILGYFKYYNFFAENIAHVLGAAGMSMGDVTRKLVLPLGISFYTFRMIGYSVDVYRGDLRTERNIICFALFVAFFPQLIAGPIERATKLLPQFKRVRTVTWSDVSQGAWLIVWGYWLKCFLADNLAPVVNFIFAHANSITAFEGLMGLYGYAFQIFGDFAGYSMIAIGLGRLMGISLMTNFLYPYFVTNPQDFWRHWHISLSRWLRDYLYIPLGGSRGGKGMIYRNLALTMLLGGIWHGPSWTFVAWGAYQGLILVIHRLVSGAKTAPTEKTPTRQQKIVRLVKVVFMFHVTCLGWLFFRASSLEQVWQYVASMCTHPMAMTALGTFALLFVAFHALPMLVITGLQARYESGNSLKGFPDRTKVAIYVLMVMTLTLYAEYGAGKFLYSQF